MTHAACHKTVVWRVALRQTQITNAETITLTRIELVSHPANGEPSTRRSKLGACNEMTEARQSVGGIGKWWHEILPGLPFLGCQPADFESSVLVITATPAGNPKEATPKRSGRG